MRECRRSIKHTPLLPLARLKRRLKIMASVATPPPAGRSSHADPERRGIVNTVARAAEVNASESNHQPGPTCAPPIPAPPSLSLAHKGREYPAQRVKLPNGPEVLVPIGFPHWRVSAEGWRWRLKLDPTTGDVKRVGRPKRVSYK